MATDPRDVAEDGRRVRPYRRPGSRHERCVFVAARRVTARRQSGMLSHLVPQVVPVRTMHGAEWPRTVPASKRPVPEGIGAMAVEQAAQPLATAARPQENDMSSPALSR